ncbi:Uncharacterized protein TCM_022316 [Theobroma cacao]|uniref:Uncharacterized protein n=1 Tax=Theobroma cacao TaxID=3641 RepID=A0A061ETK9_THECC|nr:Uncharacterized protein TCM_022316 [Theobroma cacao]
MRPSVKQMQVFESISYGRIPEEHQDKFLPKAQIGVLNQSRVDVDYEPFHFVNIQDINVLLVDEDEIVDEAPVRGVRSIQDIHQRCQLAMTKPSSFVENFFDEHCVKHQALRDVENQGEIGIIHYNKGEQIVDTMTKVLYPLTASSDGQTEFTFATQLVVVQADIIEILSSVTRVNSTRDVGGTAPALLQATWPEPQFVVAQLKLPEEVEHCVRAQSLPHPWRGNVNGICCLGANSNPVFGN